jgi:natural product biosynthesis luciferase-like monooxygenase protein
MKGSAAMDFGIMFFSSLDSEQSPRKYDLLLESTRFADERGFRCVWTPERHFHEFGGLFPNPAVTSAALATITRNLQIRAGSLISPLHDPIRIAEEWSVVDNLSAGRVAISFGSGWNVNDFIFFPERYERRQRIMYEQIDLVKRLWRGEAIPAKNSFGKEHLVRLYPRPVQAELPIWITSSGNVETFRSAGAIGANLLTHLIGQDLKGLAEKIAQYRRAREEHGFDARSGIVTLMLHTFLGADLDEVRRMVKKPFCDYLRSAVSLEQLAALGGGAISGGHTIEPHEISEDLVTELLDLTFARYFETGSLMGTVASCEPMVWRLADTGVDEIACLLDFGVGDVPAVLDSLERVDVLRRAFSADSLDRSVEDALDEFTEPLE